jgi:hypothetical protein
LFTLKNRRSPWPPKEIRMMTDHSNPREHTRTKRAVARRAMVGFSALLLLFFVFPAIGRAAGPELSLALAHEPSVFMRGDTATKFTVQVTNTGDQPTVGKILLEPSLSAGLALRNIQGADFGCPTALEIRQGAPFICETFVALAPGESLQWMMTVFVDEDGPDLVSASVTASNGGAPAATATEYVSVIDRPPFEFTSFSARATDEADADYKLAGGHPYAGNAEFALSTFSGVGVNNTAVEELRDAYSELPPGFLGIPSAIGQRCSAAQLTGFFPTCPLSSRVGTVVLRNAGAENSYPLYAMVPEEGFPAEFGFSFVGKPVTLYAQVRPRSQGFGITVFGPGISRIEVNGVNVILDGTPNAHNFSGGPEVPFLSNPVDCSNADPTTRIIGDSWSHPARLLADGFPDLTDPNWKTATASNPQVIGCSDPALVSQWDPTISTAPVREDPGAISANQPAGFRVHLHFEQSNDPTDPAYISGERNYDPETPQAPELKTATVTLPVGMAISPSGANGLGACSDQPSAPAGDQVRYDDTLPVTCTDSAKIGTVTVTSPLLARRDSETDVVTGPEPVSGDVYVLAPHPGDLPAGGEGGGKYRLLIQIENNELGLNVKLPGVAVANKDTGQLTATFSENPQLPVKDLELEFFKGQRAALSTPKTCGTFTTTTDLEAWSAPGTPNAHPQATFDVGAGPNGSPSSCVFSLGQRSFGPTFEAGTTNSKAGSSAPFVLNLSRGDSEQEFSSLNVNLPPGLTAKLAGVPYCPEAAIASAKTKSGAAEQASPSCAAASQVGTLTTSAGPGTDPYTVFGKAYLAGPYNGAPLSFVFVTPAVAGPFDFGNVVVRAAAFVNPENTQVTVKTDPIPQILDGVPLGIRSIQAKIDRPDFTLNPTNCEPMAVGASINGSNGASASPSAHFRVGDCRALGFKPKLALKLKGGTARGDHPALKAVLAAKEGMANIARTSVALPHSEFLAQNHIRTVCTRVQFNAGQGNGAECPKGSIYGRAMAITPLLDQPLSGPVYLRSSSNPLPDLVAALHGQLNVTLVGRIDSKNGGIRTTFDSVPDAPVTKFVLEMKGGKEGLLDNSRNLCKSVNKVTARFDAQNGRRADLRPALANGCESKHGKAKKPKRFR